MRAHLCQEIIASRKKHEHTIIMVLLKEWFYFVIFCLGDLQDLQL